MRVLLDAVFCLLACVAFACAKTPSGFEPLETLTLAQQDRTRRALGAATLTDLRRLLARRRITSIGVESGSPREPGSCAASVDDLGLASAGPGQPPPWVERSSWTATTGGVTSYFAVGRAASRGMYGEGWLRSDAKYDGEETLEQSFGTLSIREERRSDGFGKTLWLDFEDLGAEPVEIDTYLDRQAGVAYSLACVSQPPSRWRRWRDAVARWLAKAPPRPAVVSEFSAAAVARLERDLGASDLAQLSAKLAARKVDALSVGGAFSGPRRCLAGQAPPGWTARTAWTKRKAGRTYRLAVGLAVSRGGMRELTMRDNARGDALGVLEASFGQAAYPAEKFGSVDLRYRGSDAVEVASQLDRERGIAYSLVCSAD